MKLYRNDGIPRSIDHDLMIPAEKAICGAMLEIEKLGAHPDLTKIIMAMGQVKVKLSEYVDDHLLGPDWKEPMKTDSKEKPVKLTLTRSNIKNVKPEHVRGKTFVGVDLVGITVAELEEFHRELYIALTNCMISTKSWFNELQTGETGG